MRKQYHKFKLVLLCALLIASGAIQAQSPKKLQKLVEKQKYEKLISSSYKRLKKGEHDSLSYYYLTVGHLLKSMYSNGTIKERSYYAATKYYKKFIGQAGHVNGYDLQAKMLLLGHEVYNELSERKNGRRKYYATFFANYYNDSVPDYSDLFAETNMVNTESIDEAKESRELVDINSVQRLTEGIPYRIPEILPSGFDIVKTAENSMGTPWVWAGVTPVKGFDCSGFIIWTYQQLGYELPHRTKLLAKIGKFVQPGDFKPSDIVCFGSTTYNPASVWHVGMIHSVNGEEVNMIHCGTSSGVTVVPLSSGYWSESNYFVVRIEE